MITDDMLWSLRDKGQKAARMRHLAEQLRAKTEAAKVELDAAESEEGHAWARWRQADDEFTAAARLIREAGDPER